MAGPEYSARISAKSLAELYKDAKVAPGIMQIELRRGVKKAGERVRVAVRDRAATFSRQIPPKVKTKVSLGRSAGVRIIVDDPSGEAGALNNRDRSGTFRHPVFGDRNNWVSQAAHPFFVTAAQPAAVQAVGDIRHVMDDVARKLGFV
jgi:hypothetical protein